jgi:NMD protein affecting ribosome stability and mRNA decay
MTKHRQAFRRLKSGRDHMACSRCGAPAHVGEHLCKYCARQLASEQGLPRTKTSDASVCKWCGQSIAGPGGMMCPGPHRKAVADAD